MFLYPHLCSFVYLLISKHCGKKVIKLEAFIDIRSLLQNQRGKLRQGADDLAQQLRELAAFSVWFFSTQFGLPMAA